MMPTSQANIDTPENAPAATPDNIPPFNSQEFAQRVLQQIEALGPARGKQADRLAIAAWAGAMFALNMIGDKRANVLGIQAHMIISVRGADGARQIAGKE